MESNASGSIFIRGNENGDYDFPTYGTKADSVMIGTTGQLDIVLRLDCLSPLEIECLAVKLAKAYKCNCGRNLGAVIQSEIE